MSGDEGGGQPDGVVIGGACPADVRVVVIGESLVDVVAVGSLVEDRPGGSPANVAVALGRLGHHPDLLTVLAEDPRGQAVRGWLEASAVRVVSRPPSTGRTSTAEVTLAADGSAQYAFDLAWDLPGDVLAEVVEPGIVHAGSIAGVLPPGSATVETALQTFRGRALTSFDPNARPAITPDVAATRARVEDLVGLVDVVKVSADDLAWYYPGLAPAAAARRWLGSGDDGPVLAVVTLGGGGMVILRDDDVVRVPAVPVQVVDTIGAGDSFTGALLDGLASLGAVGPAARDRVGSVTRDELAELGRWAVRAAAITVTRPGADPPDRATLRAAVVAPGDL